MECVDKAPINLLSPLLELHRASRQNTQREFRKLLRRMAIATLEDYSHHLAQLTLLAWIVHFPHTTPHPTDESDSSESSAVRWSVRALGGPQQLVKILTLAITLSSELASLYLRDVTRARLNPLHYHPTLNKMLDPRGVSVGMTVNPAAYIYHRHLWPYAVQPFPSSCIVHIPTLTHHRYLRFGPPPIYYVSQVLLRVAQVILQSNENSSFSSSSANTVTTLSNNLSTASNAQPPVRICVSE